MPTRPSHVLASPPATRAAPLPDQPAALLGNLTPTQFMRRYWQKKPLLIRQAIPGIQPPLTREQLFDLADDDDVESRLITHFRKSWAMEHGPFDPEQLPSVKKRDWTLLVQGLNLHVDAARALLDRFRFLPDARVDDLMISYATDGGGVGAHFDSYDVFLLQVHGKRRWRIGAQGDLSLKEGLPLKVLQHFEADEEWLLEPGDMLYLPPHIAHEGVAEGECMTCSIGFRAPSEGELSSQFLYHLAERMGDGGDPGSRGAARASRRYTDPQQAPVTQPAQLPPMLVERVGSILANIEWNEKDIASFLGIYLSEPKANVVFDPPESPLNEKRFIEKVGKTGLKLDRKTVLLYDRQFYFLNGEQTPMSAKTRKWVMELADKRSLEGKRFVTLSSETSMTALLHEWYCAGWIQVDASA